MPKRVNVEVVAQFFKQYHHAYRSRSSLTSITAVVHL